MHDYKPSPIQHIKTTSKFQRLLGEVVFTNFVVQECDTQTGRQKPNIFGSSGGVRCPKPTKLGMLTEDLEHILAPIKLESVALEPLDQISQNFNM